MNKVVELLERVLSAERQPICLHYGEGEAAHSINRRNWCWAPTWGVPPIKRCMGLHPNVFGPKDETLRAIALSPQADDREPTAMIWNYACHPVTTHSPSILSADYPGAVRTRIRRRFGKDMPVVFLPGFSGNVRPNRVTRLPFSLYYLLHRVVNGPIFGRFTPDASRRWSATLADRLLEATNVHCDCATPRRSPAVAIRII